MVKSPKVYLTDTGLQLFLLNVDLNRLKQGSLSFWKCFRKFCVVLEILKQLSWSDLRIDLYHYRDYAQNEVDIVLEEAWR